MRHRRDVSLNQVREHVLSIVERMSFDELKHWDPKWGTYKLDEPWYILDRIIPKLPEDEGLYVRRASKLVRASLEASIEKSIEARKHHQRSSRRRRRRV